MKTLPKFEDRTTGLKNPVKTVRKSGRIWLKSVAVSLAASLLFSFSVPPFAQASLWQERKNAAQILIRNQEIQRNDFFHSESSRPVGNRKRNLTQEAFGIAIPEDLGSIVESWGD